MKYEIEFKAFVKIEAENESDAIQKAWLQKNLNHASYQYTSCKEVSE